MSVEQLGQTLKNLRSETGLTQKAVAAHLNISRQAYGKYELGGRTPSISILKNLADLYHCQLNTLIEVLTDSDSNETGKIRDESSYLVHTPLTSAEQALLIHFKELSTCDQQDIIEYTIFRKTHPMGKHL